jgi:hypothetical protein
MPVVQERAVSPGRPVRVGAGSAPRAAVLAVALVAMAASAWILTAGATQVLPAAS